jgi:hypothetical protein
MFTIARSLRQYPTVSDKAHGCRILSEDIQSIRHLPSPLGEGGVDMGWSDCSSRGMPSSEYGKPGCVGHFETDEASQTINQWINPRCHHQASTDHRTISTRNKRRPPRRSASKFLGRSRSVHETRSSDVLEASNVKRFVEVLTIGVETVACTGPIFQVRQGAFSVAPKFFESRKIFSNAIRIKKIFRCEFLPFGRSGGPRWLLPWLSQKALTTAVFFERNLA